MKYTIQEEIGKYFLDHVVQLVKEGRSFVFVLDNVDWDVKVHDMRSDKQNRSVHTVATSIVFDCVFSNHLPDVGPKNSLANNWPDCFLGQPQGHLKDTVSLTDEETRCTRERYKVLIGRILVEVFSAFDFLKDVVPDHTPCEYHKEMSTKSVVAPLPVLFKDEKKYAEVVDVLDQLELWTCEIYSKAGLCNPADPEHVPPGPSIGAPVRLDQPASHVPPVPQIEDPLAHVKIPCYGNQLTRVRLAGAKDL